MTIGSWWLAAGLGIVLGTAALSAGAAEGGAEPAPELVRNDRQNRGARPVDRRLSPEVCDHGISAGARRPVYLRLQEREPRQGSALVRKEYPGFGPIQVRRIRDRPVDQ